MAKTKRIVCPHCRAAHLPGSGYHFNENLSMICDECKKVIFPTVENDEVGIPKAADRRYTAHRGYYQHRQDYEFDVNFA